MQQQTSAGCSVADRASCGGVDDHLNCDAMAPFPPGTDCWGTGGPEWLFGLALFGPIVGVMCLLLWAIIIKARTGQWELGRRYPKVRPQVWQALFVGALALYVYLQIPDILEPMRERHRVAAAFAAMVAVSGGLLAVASWRATSLRWDDLRNVPWPILVALPVLGAFCVLMAQAAAAAMLVLGGPC
jgi:di/tricarboxylate transporter